MGSYLKGVFRSVKVPSMRHQDTFFQDIEMNLISKLITV